jgi:large subunit ribosomal protein L14e
MLDVGRVCIKTAGREAGRACVVIDTIDETYVMITGPKSLTRVKRRKCNIAHLEPLEFQLKLAKNAGDTDVARLLQAEKILEKLTSGKPLGRPERPKKEAPGEKAPGEEAKKEKKSLRERILSRARREEKPGEGKRPEKTGPGKPGEIVSLPVQSMTRDISSSKAREEMKRPGPKGQEKPRAERKKPAAKKPAKKAKPARKAKPKQSGGRKKKYLTGKLKLS